MPDLPLATNDWPEKWRRWFRRAIKLEMLEGNTFEHASRIAEQSCRLEYGLRVLEQASRGQFPQRRQHFSTATLTERSV